MLKKIPLILLTIFLFTILSAGIAHARRGRSYGGRSFGSSRRSYGSSRRSYGGYRSGRSYGYRRYGYRRYGYGYSRGGFICSGGGFIVMGIVAAMVVIIIVIAMSRRGKNVSTPGMGTIAMLQVAFYTKQGSIRKEFNRIGDSANFDSPSGLAQFLNKAMIFIGRHSEDISHYYFECSDKMDIGRLEHEFESKVSSEKMKYNSGPGGATSSDELEIDQHVVISAFIASERVDLKNEQVGDIHSLKQTANKLSGISARSIYAVEIILDPSDTQDSLSRETMEIEFPKLIRI